MNKVRLTLLLVLVILVSSVTASYSLPKTAPLSKDCSKYGATALTVKSDVGITPHLLISILFSEKVKAFSWIDLFNVNFFSLNSGRVENSLQVYT